MKPDGTLTVDEVMQYVDQLQNWEREELGERLSGESRKRWLDDLSAEEIRDARQDLHFYSEPEDALDYIEDSRIIRYLDMDFIISYLETEGYTVVEDYIFEALKRSVRKDD